jgi:glycerol kinase
VADLLEAVQDDSGIPLSELRVDGGAAVNDAMLQLQADLLGVPVVRPKVTETTALGAAYLAGLAVGVWESAGTVSRQWQVDKRFEPALSSAVVARRRAEWRAALERAKGWAQRG